MRQPGYTLRHLFKYGVCASISIPALEVQMPSLATPDRAVLLRVRKAPLKPTKLLADLTCDYSYSEIQDALSVLLEEGELILTPDLLLEVPHHGRKGRHEER